jgi:hypothetical protein
MHSLTICWIFTVVLIGCGVSQPAGRTPLTQEQCEAKNGTIVIDPGDGRTHVADYVCPSGKAPLGDIEPSEGGPVFIEGAVCCPR